MRLTASCGFYSLVALALLSVGAAAPVHARTPSLADTLVWEKIGLPSPSGVHGNGKSVTFDPSGALVAVGYDAMRWRPDGSWEPAFPTRFRYGRLRFEPDGDILTLTGHAVRRSRDGGATWAEYLPDPGAETWPVTTPTGAILVGTDHNRIGRSADDGATWTVHDYPDTQAFPTGGLSVLPPGVVPGLPPSGRAVAAGLSGIATSDDDGLTWTPSDLWCIFCVYAQGVVTLDGGPHSGELRASVDDNRPGGVSAGVWASTDGISWRRIGRSNNGAGVTLQALPGGRLLAYNAGNDILRASDDGGATWRSLGRVDPSRPNSDLLRLYDIALGPDGRLYAAVTARPGVPYAGVYRTVAPYLAVTEEPAPSAGDSALRVEPNPATGHAAARWRQASAGAARVSVYDARGREVLVLAEGHRQPGEHTAEVDTSALAPGVYVVRVASAEGVASASFTVAR